MGRHSAPDGSSDDTVAGARPAAVTAPRRHPRPARHEHPDGAPPTGNAAQDDDRHKPGPSPRTAPLIQSPVDTTKKPQPRIVSQPSLADLPRIDLRPALGDLDLIEDALYGAEPAAVEQRAADVTEQIPVIVDPMPDGPSPEAVTTVLPAVVVEAVVVEEGEDSAEPTTRPSRFGTRPRKPSPPVGPGDQPTVALEPTAAPPAAVGKHTDLELLKARGDVRARAIAAVLAPFVLYVVTLVVVGSLEWRPFLIWIWVPLVSAGVLLGIVLDAGHKTHDQELPGPDPVSE